MCGQYLYEDVFGVEVWADITSREIYLGLRQVEVWVDSTHEDIFGIEAG